jgi:hypothetical protein
MTLPSIYSMSEWEFDFFNFNDPFYRLAPIVNALSMLGSCIMIYRISTQKVAMKGFVKWTLLAMQLWSILSQTVIILVYQFFSRTNQTDEWYKPFSGVWLVENTQIALIIFLNLFILELFKPSNEQITTARIWMAQKTVIVVFTLIQIIPMLRLTLDGNIVSKISILQIEGHICAGFVLSCIIYDNVQAGYLVMLIRKFHYRHGKSKQETVSKSLLTSVLMNALVVVLDWITVLLFLAQLFFFPRTTEAAIIQQVAGAITGIHSSLSVLVFQNLRTFTFPNPRKIELVKVPSTKSAHDTQLLS